MNPFLNRSRHLRNGWWILIFFLVLASMLIPLIFIFQNRKMTVTPGEQAAVVAIASLICQFARRRPVSELVGPLDWRWLRQLFSGCAAGLLLMIVPAILLWSLGCLTWHWNDTAGFAAVIAAGFSSAAGVAVTEELIFRGFLFQRLIDGLGTVPAQLICAGYFVVIHLDRLGAAGNLKYLAGLNIFVASIVFGLAFIRTRSLAPPIGIHLAANFAQGTMLGFGVSGDNEPGLLKPVFHQCPNWLTGGTFGLEASLPGFLCIAALGFLFYRIAKDRVRARKSEGDR